MVIRRRFQRLFNGVSATVSPALRRRLERQGLVKRVWDDARVEGTMAESVPLIGAPTVWAGLGVTGAAVSRNG